MMTTGSRQRLKPNLPGGPPRARRSFRLAVGCAVLVAGSLLPSLAGQAQDVTQDGLYITVSNPITEAAVSKIKQRVNDAVERQKRTLKVVVFDFNPNGKPSGSSNFFPCLELTTFINQLAQGEVQGRKPVPTVAYVRDEVTDHTVLPVVACREIVMASKGKIGLVLRAQAALPDDARPYYKKALANLLKDEAKADKVLHKMLLKPAGEGNKALAMFDLEELRKEGPSIERLETPASVKDQYKLPALSLREDMPSGDTPVVWRIEVHGAIDGGKLNSLERRIKNAIRKKANLIILHLDCDGGEILAAASMAEKLRNLTEENGGQKIKTVAYVPSGKSLGAATFLAVGCSEIAMAPDARLGGFDYLNGSDPKDLEVWRKMLSDVAAAQGYHVALFEAMLEPGATVYYCRHTTRDTFKVLTGTELKKTKEWEPIKAIASAGEKNGFFILDAATALQYGVARHTDVATLATLYERYEIADAGKVEVSRDDWLDAVARFLRQPIVQVLLIMVGIAGLILELKMPGFGVPGIIAAICFVLFFWAHAFAGQSTREFTLLAILLFVLGLVLLGIEIFVLPGFGVTGISGILLIVVSLVLVLLEQMPATSQEWLHVGGALTKVAIGLVAGLIGALTIARYLPHMPYANRLVLQPPVEDFDPGTETTAERLRAASLLGAIGVAATTLRPAGKAQFGDEFVDVVAEGDYVNAGARVQVIEIEGNRIAVKEL
jgi:membrane-bound serine protease (ClpP class)